MFQPTLRTLRYVGAAALAALLLVSGNLVGAQEPGYFSLVNPEGCRVAAGTEIVNSCADNNLAGVRHSGRDFVHTVAANGSAQAALYCSPHFGSPTPSQIFRVSLTSGARSTCPTQTYALASYCGLSEICQNM